ncbi:MAG: HAMP domain-containing histidine kinase [Leptospirales bacterium]|nr:HAMP domain-containing histidine kinase [Leptospirales bacterium]
MRESWISWLVRSRISATMLFVGCVLGEGLIAYAHTQLPYYANLVLLYLFPIIMVTWLIGRPAGLGLAFLSSSFWLLAQTMNRPEEVDLVVHFWNAFVRVLIFFGLVLLVHWMRQTIAHNEGIAARLQARRSFLASVSHEMRDPMQRILTGLDIMENFQPGNVLDRIREATWDLQELVDGVLELARMEGAQTTFRADFNPVVVVREVLNHLQSMATQRSQVFSLEIDPAVPSLVRADQNCLRYTTTRLLRASSQFSGTGAIVVGLKFSAADGMFVVSIQDFARESGSNNSDRSRDGLGLHVAREMARLNGGKVWRGESQGSESIHFFSMPVEVL